MDTQTTEAAQIGARVRALRIERGWSQETLGPRRSGLSRETVRRVENGGRMPDGDTLSALAYAFGLTLSELLEGVTRAVLSGEPATAAA